ncbi:MAG: ATPase, T2SS/T4P/T4SS family, partial [Candidatus Lokiarchaeota archaeon]
SDKIANFIMKKLQSIEINDIYSLESLIKFYQEKCVEILTLNYDFDKDLIIKVSFYSTLRFLNLLKLFPLLHDDYIEEIFLDSPSNYIYLNHRNYGRCRTNIFFTNNDIERVKTLIRIYSQKRIDFNNPSLKFVLKNKYFNCRFSIDIKPIHPENFALTIRKFNNKIFTIQNLLKNGTLDPLIASFLFFCMIYRINITVIGETDSGKTTFVNALDLITPKYFRKIYVENISESLDQKEFGKHQLKYRVDSVSLTNNEVLTKSAQIRSLLHKTPDLIYLGEILTKEESEAMFHCLAAGLTGFQTIHAKSVESFINRVLYHFKINRACLNDLGVLILMRKDINLKRRVLSINEIIGVNEENEKYYREIFTYNPKLEKWFLKYDLYKTSIVQGLKNSEDFNFSKFWGLIRYYYTFFLKVSKSNLISKNFLVELFNQLSQKTFLSEKTFFTNN